MKTVVTFCFLLSGVSSLIFQVVWTRMLGLVFGTSSFAITTVLTAFMSGLAIGAWVTGRLSDSRAYNYLRGYGFLEILIAIYGCFTPQIISYLMERYAVFYQEFSPNLYVFSLLRFLILFLVILPPTVLMGATLPLLCKFFTHRQDEKLGLKIGLLYGLNTFGAVLGTLLAGFILVPFFGVNQTIFTAAAIGGFAGVVAFILSFRLTPAEQGVVVVDLPKIQEERVSISRSDIRFLLVAFAFSGAISLSYEVGWSRVLVLILGGAVYSFTTMLATFLLGLALGAVVMARLLDRLLPWGKEIFCILQLLIGLTAFLAMHLFQKLPDLYVNWVYLFHHSFPLFHLMKCLLAATIMFLPTFFIGMIFPLIARLYALRADVGNSVGDVYSVNTLGSIVGSFLMGFVFIPFFGVSSSLFFCVTGNIFLALIGWIVLKKALIPATLHFVLFVLFLAFLPPWNPSQMTSGVFRYAKEIYLRKKQDEEEAKFLRRKVETSVITYSKPELQYYEEGLTATVSVHQRGESLVMKINGKPDASSHADLPVQMLEAHLPNLLYPGTPEETLLIGLATGITAGSAACYSPKLVCLEIEEATLRAAQLFEPYNRGVIQKGEYGPKIQNFELKIIDARNYLLGTQKEYSMIISSPSHPWLTGGSNLFTKEFFQLCKARLKPEGILCQWLQLYEISWETLKVLLETLHSEFPYLVVFQSESNVIITLASKQPIPLDWKQIQKRMENPEVQKDLARLQITHPFHLVARYFFSIDEAKSLFQGNFYNTDDNAYVEFITPRQLFGHKESTKDILRRFWEAAPFPLKPWLVKVAPEEKLECVREYIKTFLLEKNYNALLHQASYLLNEFEGEEQGEISAWLGYTAFLAKTDPTSFFRQMEEKAPHFSLGTVWKQEWLLLQEEPPLTSILEALEHISLPEASRVRTRVYFLQKQFELAIQEAEKSIGNYQEWTPQEQTDFLNSYGRALIQQKQPNYAKAIEILKKSEKIYWDEKGKSGVLSFDDIDRDIAFAALQLNQLEEASVYLIRSFKLRQGQSVFYYRKAMQLSEESSLEKLQFLEKATTLDPSFYQAAREYWKLLQRLDPEKSKQLEQSLQERFPWFPSGK